MATIFKPVYGSATAMTLNADAVTNTSARQGAVVDNTTDLFQDVVVMGKVRTAAGSLATYPVVYIWVYAIGEGGSYSGGASGSDAAYTMPSYRSQFGLGAVVVINTADTDEIIKPFNVAALFGGFMPQKWGIIVENQSGLTLKGSGGGHVSNSFSYQGVQTQGV